MLTWWSCHTCLTLLNSRNLKIGLPSQNLQLTLGLTWFGFQQNWDTILAADKRTSMDLNETIEAMMADSEAEPEGIDAVP